jgi:Ribbon-helix-helix protein, copG family
VATTSEKQPNDLHVVQAVLDHATAERLRAEAKAERRTISAIVRNLIQDRLDGRLR